MYIPTQTELFPEEHQKSFTEKLVELLASPATARMLKTMEDVRRDEEKRQDYNRKRREGRAESKQQRERK